MGKKANESQQVIKARQKLEKKFAQENRNMTRESLAKMAQLIEQQLVRYARERIDLKSKEIQLFDENQHPAAIKSKFISRLLSNLKTGLNPPLQTSRQKTQKSLKGRVKTQQSYS